jgi:hypothetical protein
LICLACLILIAGSFWISVGSLIFSARFFSIESYQVMRFSALVLVVISAILVGPELYKLAA